MSSTARRFGGVVQGGIAFASSVTVNISSDTDDLVVPDLENTVEIRLNVTGNRTLTGIVPFDDTLAQWITIFNVGTGNLSLKNNNVGSSANNRFLLGANKTVQSDEGVSFIYDDQDKRWRSFGINI